jgi:hypothetical protein
MQDILIKFSIEFYIASCSANLILFVRFEIFTAVTMKNAVFWDVAPCISRLQPPAYAGPSLADFVTLKMEAIRSSETSVHTRSTQRHIPEDGIILDIFCLHHSVHCKSQMMIRQI